MLLSLLFVFLATITETLALKFNALDSNELKTLQKRFNTYNSNSSNETIQGISIGGWLVTEPYITPSLYKNATNILSTLRVNSTNSSSLIDEYTLCKLLGYNRSKELLDNHFKTWITEDDIKQVKENGFNLVRLPIGYWAWKLNHTTNTYIGNISYDDPYIGEGLQLKYLDKALQWAQKYDLNVWIDLHGAPGSQNGFDNSGQRNFYNDLGWLSDYNSKALTLKVWQEMFDKYLNKKNYTNIVGIEILNEPLAPKLNFWDVTQSFYEAFDIFKASQPSNDNTSFIIHDAFQSINHWNLDFNPQYHNVSDQYFNLTNITYSSQSVWVDHHHYEVFTDNQVSENQYSRIMNIINYGESISEELPSHPAVVGEWSGALTDCATWLNGLGVGARYDGSYYNTTSYKTDSPLNGTCQSQNSIDKWDEEYRISVRQFIEAQIATYNAKTSGWIFWNWKTENAPEWDYLKLKKANLFPYPFDNLTYFQNNGEINASFSSSLSKDAFTATSSLSSTLATSSGSMASAKSNVGSSLRLNAFPQPIKSGLTMKWKIGLSIGCTIVSSVLFCL